MRPKVQFRSFRGVLKKWPQLFEEAAQFASEIGPDRLINISHSEDNEDGVVTVWFWSDR